MNFSQLTLGVPEHSKPQLTLKDQTESIQTSLQHLRKVLQTQRKNHNQLFLQIKKMQDLNQKQFKQVSEDILVKSEGSRGRIDKQQEVLSNQMNYLDMQSNTLGDQHTKFAQMLEFSEERGHSLRTITGI